MSLDPLRNPKDPLRKSGPDQQHELFRRFAREADGFSTEDAVGAALNVLINALRQAHSTRGAAEASYNEHVGRMKQILMNHYDGAGRRLNLFPHHQVINMPHLDDRDKIAETSSKN